MPASLHARQEAGDERQGALQGRERCPLGAQGPGKAMASN